MGDSDDAGRRLSGAGDDVDSDAEAGAREPPAKRARSDCDDDDYDDCDEDEMPAGPDVRRNWVDLDGCVTLQDVRRVLHARFQTSQMLLDYIQTYRDTRLLKIIPLLMERPRQRLAHICTLEHVCNLLSTCKNILVLTGAGVSVSAGIPDFRSTDGIYRRLKDEFGMPTPECMFDKEYFDRNPQVQ